MGCLRWLAFVSLLAGAVFGAGPENIVPSHRHDIWGVGSGFPGGYIYSIAQTGDGYLLIGSSKGLIEYDGLRFAFIRAKDSSSQSNFPVLGLVRDSTAQLWAIDDLTHLFRYADGRLFGPVPDNGLHRHRAAAVNTTQRGSLLFASELQGVIEYEHGASRIVLDPSATPSWPTAVAQTADGVVWIGTRDSGLFRLSVTHGIPEIEHVAGRPNAKINCLLPIAASTLLVGTNKGLLSLHDGQLIPQTGPEVNNQAIFALASGLQGQIWIGAEGGLFKADANDVDSDGTIQSLEHWAVHSPVTSLFEDRDENLWIGGPDTIECYRRDEFNTYSSAAGLPASNCGAIYIDEQTDAWFAPWDGGLFRLSKGRVEAITVAGLEDDTVYSIDGTANEIWVARKYGGVTRLKRQGGVFQSLTYRRQDGLAQESVYAIYRAADGAIWAGTLNEGVSRFRAGKWHTFTTQDGLPSNRISAITGNGAGEVFVGTPNGLASLKRDGWATYTTRDGLPPGAIESLFLDHTGTLWLGTAKGISFLESGAIHVPVGAPEPLYGELLGMAESNGWLWMTTGNHVLRVKSSALRSGAFAAGDYREFALTDGLPSVEGVKRSRSVVEDSRGRVWFSLNGGISVLQAFAFTRPPFPVTIRLEGVLVDGKLIAPGGQIRIPPGQRRVKFLYTGVNLSNPEGVRYRYRLDNVDSGWSEPTAAREVDYTNIPPGHFKFHVAARNPDGFWSGHEAAMTFDVEPAFWQNRTYRLVGFATLLVAAWGIHRLRLRRMIATVDLRHAERLAERTRIARELHDTLLQSFHGLMLRLQLVDELLPPGPAKEELEQTLERGDQAIAEGRSAVHDLRSSTTTTNELAQAVRSVADELASEGSPTFRLMVEGPVRDLHPIPRDDVYRIAREGLRNAFSHSRASRIEAEITYGERLFRLRIRDDGDGIPPDVLQAGRAGHYGLAGMHERARQTGGKLDIWSGAGKGTEIDLSIPASVAYSKSPRRSRLQLFRRKAG
jgi:signal transduction histidine kinase/ligand-binding sensor domain-containing protein